MRRFFKTIFIRLLERVLDKYLSRSLVQKFNHKNITINFIFFSMSCGLYHFFCGLDADGEIAIAFLLSIPLLVNIFIVPYCAGWFQNIAYRVSWCLCIGSVSFFAGGILSPFLFILFSMPFTGSIKNRLEYFLIDFLTGIVFPIATVIVVFTLHSNHLVPQSVFNSTENDFIRFILFTVILARVYLSCTSYARIVQTKSNLSQEWQTQMNLIIENANSFLMIIDPLDQTIRGLTNTPYHISSSFAEKIRKGSFLNITFDEKARHYLLLAFYQAIRFGKSDQITIPIQVDKETCLWFDMVATGLQDQDTPYVCLKEVVFICHDVTKRIYHEINLRKARDAFEEADRAKLVFLSNMSHELKTPLNAIIGFSDLIRSEIMGPIGHPKYHEYIQAIYESGSHLLDLIVDILDISRIEAGRYEISLEKYQPVALLKECISLVSLTGRQKNIAIKFKYNCDPQLYAYGDRRATKQIILNLLNNSIKYCPDNSSVFLNLEKGELSGHYDYMIFTVQDDGYGMPEHIIRQVGTPFISWSAADVRQEGGTGLGLSIVKAMVDLQSGYLSIEAPPEGGTIIKIELPLIIQEKKQAIETKRSA